MLFSGTIRYNLDPFEQYNDHMIWKTLEYVSRNTQIAFTYKYIVHLSLGSVERSHRRVGRRTESCCQ